MIGNPTRPGDLAVVIAGSGMGAFVRVIDVIPQMLSGCDRKVVAVSQELIGLLPGSEIRTAVHNGDVGVAADEILKPIRPPSPEEQDERAEHLVGAV